MRCLLPTVALGLVLCGGASAAAQAPEPAPTPRSESRLAVGLVASVPTTPIGARTRLVRTERWTVVRPSTARASSHPPARDRAGLTLRPRVGTMRVPVRGAPPARAVTVGLTLRPR